MGLSLTFIVLHLIAAVATAVPQKIEGDGVALCRVRRFQ